MPHALEDQNPDDLPFPLAHRFDSLAQKLLALLATAEHDEAERVLLISSARELMAQLGEGLRRVEEADPEWFGWASQPPPPGSRFPLEKERSLRCATPFAGRPNR